MDSSRLVSLPILEDKNQNNCPYRGVASQGQTTTKKWRENNQVKCECCNTVFEFDDDTGYFFHP